ncbi:MAG: dethiobiotin synthase [Solirubrobacteraceae bacterium]
MRGCFVTGTDTGAGKTVVAAALLAGLAAAGLRVAASKPVLTGTDEEPDPDWPRDDVLLAAAAGGTRSSGEVAPVRFGPPVSPHLAAELAGAPLEPARLASSTLEAGSGADALVVEGTGGLLAPLTPGYLVRDLALELGLPLVVAARPGLGTISHTLLTLEAARGAGLRVAGVVLTPWPARAGAVERSNRHTIAALGAVAVHALPRIARGEPRAMAAAAASLPLDELAPEL